MGSKKKQKVKGAPPSKQTGANDSPARRAYWASGRLRARKVKAIMRATGCSEAEATIRWLDSRKGRVKK